MDHSRTRPITLLQLSDPHLGATWAEADASRGLARTVEWIRSYGPKADALLVSGDLADHAADDEYNEVRELLELLGARIYVLPGNHDDRDALRRHFDLPGVGSETVDYAVTLEQLCLVVVDSTRPGEDGGELTPDQLEWLNATLTENRALPTVVAMHHPPLTTGVPAWDRILLPEAHKVAFGRIVESHPQVRGILCGHLHRTLTGALNGRSVLVAPSTYVQARFAPGTDELVFTNEPPGFAVHILLEGELTSYAQTVV
jgi:3',5'-cyclic-AMP phosphodiesterase